MFLYNYHIGTHYPHEYPAYLQICLTVVAVNAMCFYMVEAVGLEPYCFNNLFALA